MSRLNGGAEMLDNKAKHEGVILHRETSHCAPNNVLRRFAGSHKSQSQLRAAGCGLQFS